MLTKFHTMYSLLNQYQHALIQGSTTNSFRKALLLDSYAYSIHKGRESMYLKPDHTSVFEMIQQFQTEKHVSAVVRDLSLDIKELLKEIDPMRKRSKGKKGSNKRSKLDARYLIVLME